MKIQDASNDDNPITKKVFDEKTESVFYYCNNLELIMRLLLNFHQFQAEIHLYQIIHSLVSTIRKKSEKSVIQVSDIYGMYYGQDAQCLVILYHQKEQELLVVVQDYLQHMFLRLVLISNDHVDGKPCRLLHYLLPIVAPPDRRECKPNLDSSGRRLCRSWQKAPLIVEPLIGLLGATSFQEPFPRNGLENNIF